MTAIIGCGSGGGSDKSDSQVIAPVQSTCVGGPVTVTVPAENVDQFVEDNDNEETQVEHVSEDVPSLDQGGALKIKTKITIVGNCNQVHTEDNDSSSTTGPQ